MAAVRCGVLHRDVKPANAMLADDGHAKLLDFGLARLVDGNAAEEPAALPLRERAGGRAHARLPPIDPVRVARWSREPTISYHPEAERGCPHGSPPPGYLAGTPLWQVLPASSRDPSPQ